MKTNLFLMSALLIASSLVKANGRSENDYIVTENDTIKCSSFSFGVSEANITLANGEKTTVDKNNVKAFSVNGRVFEILPIYVEGKPTGNNAFLELLAEKNGLKLYRNYYFAGLGWNANGKSQSDANRTTVLTVYKDKKYYANVNEKNAKTILSFFNIHNMQL